ncbi:uncharacterized protein LOC144358859, partial [Saccoglossus kowalevskii]
MASAGLFRRCFNRRMLHLVTSSRISTPLRLHRMIRTSSRVFEVDGLPIEMPALSPTMEEGKITKWLKNEVSCYMYSCLFHNYLLQELLSVFNESCYLGALSQSSDL